MSGGKKKRRVPWGDHVLRGQKRRTSAVDIRVLRRALPTKHQGRKGR